MGLTLVLEAAFGVGSVAVLDGSRVLASGTAPMRQRDREALLPAVLACLDAAGASWADVGRVVVGEGPGSFTSLRIVAATAKGLVHGTDRALAAVSSLLLAAAAAGRDDVRVVWADALRGERFAVPVARTDAGWSATDDVRIVAADDRVLASAGAVRAEEVAAATPLAAALATVRSDAVRPVDAAEWEPRYGRLAEAQVKWEAAAGRPLPASPTAAVT